MERVCKRANLYSGKKIDKGQKQKKTTSDWLKVSKGQNCTKQRKKTDRGRTRVSS